VISTCECGFHGRDASEARKCIDTPGNSFHYAAAAVLRRGSSSTHINNRPAQGGSTRTTSQCGVRVRYTDLNWADRTFVNEKPGHEGEGLATCAHSYPIGNGTVTYIAARSPP